MNLISKLHQRLKSAPNQVAPLTDEALQKVVELLSTVGLTERYGFPSHAQDYNSYQSGVLEWTERGHGVRFRLYTRPGKRVHLITVTNLNRNVLSEAELFTINNSLADILSDFNN